MTQPNDSIQPIVYRQTGDNESRIASEKDIRQGEYLIYTEGLTKRELFAAMAMQGILANRDLQIALYKDNKLNGTTHENAIAYDAVKEADFLIKELNKTKQQ